MNALPEGYLCSEADQDRGRSEGVHPLYLALDLVYAMGLSLLVAYAATPLLQSPLPMALQMLAAMALGMALATLVSFLASVALGMFEAMILGMWTGMTASMVGIADSASAWARLGPALLCGATVWGLVSLANYYYRSKRPGVRAPADAPAPAVGAAIRKRKKSLAFWDKISPLYDLIVWGSDRRNQRLKRQAFSGSHGRVLFVGAGTGRDFDFMPPGLKLYAVDISQGMLEKARPKAERYAGKARLIRCDIARAPFPSGSFDTVVTSCVFCSVAEPVQGLQEVRRLLSPGGKLIMFEHVLSRNPLLSFVLRSMNPLSSGPDFTRDTERNALAAGWDTVEHRNAYMDIVKIITAER
ncbi:MAG: class I SAM-dependent methyltransferase [bacterium]